MKRPNVKTFFSKAREDEGNQHIQFDYLVDGRIWCTNDKCFSENTWSVVDGAIVIDSHDIAFQRYEDTQATKAYIAAINKLIVS